MKKLGMLQVERENIALRNFTDIETDLQSSSKDENGSDTDMKHMRELIAKRLAEDEMQEKAERKRRSRTVRKHSTTVNSEELTTKKPPQIRIILDEEDLQAEYTPDDG